MKRKTSRLMVGVIGLVLVLYALFFIKLNASTPFSIISGSENQAQASGLKGKKAELASLKLLTKCVSLVRQYYISQSLVKPKKMLVSALKSVENMVPEVMVKLVGEPPKQIDLHVGYKERMFDLSKVNDLYKMNWRMLDIFRFIARYLPDDFDPEDVEYVAINGMLKTLDEHTTFLPPKAYNEMKLDTQGQFGGLGIVITVRKGYITVMSVMPNTPAAKAGLKSKDQIVQIEDETTLNMPLLDAVSRLRGKPGTKVTIYVKRAGWSVPHSFKVTREIIHVRSVESRYLGDRIGYVSLKRFQRNSAEELRVYIDKLLKNHHILGLVLDLRQNPGGLLDQAVQCARLFINKGEIVTTTEVADMDGETYRALGYAPYADLPMVVLVDGGSASAAEILTVALKKNNRAVVVGNRTFGKGTVQVMREVGKGALKITIGQYLGPGRVSIQGVGIMPHVELVPVTISKKMIRLLNPDARPKSKAFYKLKAMGPLEKDKPVFVMKYLQKIDEPSETNDDEPPLPQEDTDPSKDFEVKLALDMLKRGGSAKADELFRHAKPVLDKIALQQDQLLVKKLDKLNRDWTKGPLPKDLKIKAFVAAVPKTGALAGSSITFFIAAKNLSDQPVYRIHGVTHSEEPILDDQEFIIGKIPPHAIRRTKLTIELPKSIEPELNRVSFKFFADQKPIDVKAQTEARFKAFQRPRFAYAFQIQDKGGNGNGLAEPGETFDLVFDVTNTGEGPAKKLLATLQNKSGRGVLVRVGRMTLKHGIGVGRTRQLRFRVSLTKDFKESTLKLALGLTTLKLRTFLSEELNIPVYKPLERQVTPVDMALEVIGKEAVIYPGADQSLSALYTVEQGAMLRAVGKVGAFYKVSIDSDRFGFISAATVRQVKGVVRFTSLPEHPFYARIQPAVYITNARDLLAGPIGPDVTIRGRAVFYGRKKARRKVFAFVGDEKVFFRMVPDTDKDTVEFKFAFPMHLKKDSETIRVFALEGKSNVNTYTIGVIKAKGVPQKEVKK